MFERLPFIRVYRRNSNADQQHMNAILVGFRCSYAFHAYLEKQSC